MKSKAARGEIIARWYANNDPCRFSWEKGRVTAFNWIKDNLPDYPVVAPALFDLQINGYGGVDFQQDDLTVEHLLHAAACLRRDGCARFFVTLITDEWPLMMARLKHLRQLRAKSAILRSAIAGWHIEGPFLSAEPGYCGAHNPEKMIDPSPRHLRQLRQVAGNDLVLITLAPERKGGLEAVKLAVRLGMVVSLGHTNAPADILVEAYAAGATGFTHLGNGCPRQLDRHDNIIWRVLDLSFITVGLIPDTHHVSPALFRLLHRGLESSEIYYTTDAMAAAGAPPGNYRLGRLELEVGADGVVRLPGQSQFAGSSLTPVEGVRRAVAMLEDQGDWRDCWGRFSETPAHFARVDILPRPGNPATFCLIDEPRDDGGIAPEIYVDGLKV